MPFVKDIIKANLENTKAREVLSNKLKNAQLKDLDLQSQLSALYQPLIEETRSVQKAVKDSNTDISKLLEQALVKPKIPNLELLLPETPKLKPPLEIPAIKAPDNTVIGQIAQKYFSTRADDYDKTFRLKYSDDSKKHYIGIHQVDIDYDIIINENATKEYQDCGSL